MSQAQTNPAGALRLREPGLPGSGTQSAPGHYARPMRRPAGHTDPRTQFLLAALAAIEMQSRLGRHLPVTVVDRHGTGLPADAPAPTPPAMDSALPGWAASSMWAASTTWPVGPVAWHWTRWPAEALQRLCARDALSLLARSRQPQEPEQALCVELIQEPVELDLENAAVRLWCRLGDEMLSVICVCGHNDPWAPACGAIAEMYAEILHALLTQTHIQASQAPGIGRTSLQLLLAPRSAAPEEPGPFRAIPRLVEDWADREPSRIACRYGDRALSYGAFDRLANGLARRLERRGVGSGAVVPVLLDGGLEVPLAWYAVLKQGAAFVPMDPRWPAERLLQVLDQLAADVVICTDAAALPASWRDRALLLDLDAQRPSAQRPGLTPAAADAACGFFVTPPWGGRPRCALNHHGGLAHRLRFMSRYLRREQGLPRALVTAGPADPAAFWQCFWPLTAGGTVVMAPPRAGSDPTAMLHMLARHEITLAMMEPELFEQIGALAAQQASVQEQLAGLRDLVLGSAPVLPQALETWRTLLPSLRITRAHGPAEAALGMIFQPMETAEDALAVRGRPMAHCGVVVVDTGMRPLPPGACGELLICGAGVGSGYLGDPAASARAFIPNPFPTLPGPRVLRSGERGCMDAQGRLQIVRRGELVASPGHLPHPHA
jgi:non-ribosomal peptide synthetase component F